MHMYPGASFAHHFCANSVTEVRILAYENRSLFANNTLIQSSDYRWFPGSRELVFLSKESLLDLSHLRFTQSCFYELLQFKCHIIVDHTTPPTSHIAFERKEPPTLLLIIAFIVFFIVGVFICIFFIAIGLVTLIWVAAICFGVPGVLLLLIIEQNVKYYPPRISPDVNSRLMCVSARCFNFAYLTAFPRDLAKSDWPII